jgi:uroporphyrinogen-III synthase
MEARKLLTQYTMKDNEVILLSTRPLDTGLIEKADCNNITIETISFIKIEKMVSKEVASRIERLSQEKATVVFTSINALQIAVELLPVNPPMAHWNIYSLGGATLNQVKKYWPEQQLPFAGKNATELAERIINDGLNEIVFFCGNQRREELPSLLAKQGVKVEELVLYRTIETPAKVGNKYNGILFFSPSAVHSYFSQNRANKDTIFFALGNTTGNAIRRFTTNSIIVSDFPGKEQLVDKAIKFFTEKVR